MKCVGPPPPDVESPMPVSGATQAGVATAFETRLMAKALSALFAAGAALALLTVLLPHTAGANEPVLLLIVADAALVSAVLFRCAGRLRPWVLRAAVGWGTCHITAVAYFSGESPSPLIFFYLWVFLYSSYFFTKREAISEIALVGVCYGGLLIAEPPSSGGPAWWVVGMGSLIVAAILIATMRERAELLIGRLYEAARTDPLTQLLNRRGFRELLDLELERAKRGGHSMAVLAGDLDHFKVVNDRLGHHEGDAVLKRVGAALERGKRRIDAAARVGGEEFALILPATGVDGALVLAERLRADLAAELARDPIPVTISFGIAMYPDHGETAGSILQAADEAVYGAKENGRNRTVVHTAALRKARGRGGERDVRGERYVSVVLELAEAADLRFSGSARHSETVGRYAEMMARELGLSEQRVNRVRLGGILHDVGKVGVPDAVLRKPGRLTGDEWAKITDHPGLGAQILEHPSLSDVREWVGSHHERPDGNGYPQGLTTADIPLETRILAVADAYEAMTSDRPYRASLGHARAQAELRRCAGTQFDARVVESLITVLGREAGRAGEMAAAS